MITAADILNDSQVAKLLGISLDTLQRRMNKGFNKGAQTDIYIKAEVSTKDIITQHTVLSCLIYSFS